MGGLLGIIGGLVTIVASIWTLNPYGIAAGALMIAGGAAQAGLFGKGAERFMNSSTGKDLTMAIGLASAAISVASLANAPTAGAESATVANANTAAEGGAAATGTEADAAAGEAAAGSTAPVGAAGGAAPVSSVGGADASTLSGVTPAPVVSATSNEALTNPYAMVNQFNSDPGVMEDGLSPALTNGVQQSADGYALSGGVNGPGGPPIGGTEASQIQQEVNPASTASNAESAATTADQTAVAPKTAAPATPNFQDESSIAGQGTGATTPAPASQGGPETFADKLKSGAGDFLKSPAGMITAGQAVSGWAQGKAAENINQRTLAAQQWGNTQWMDPKQIAQLDQAAAAPIPVPSGYLARAAALRSLTAGTTQQTTPLQQTPPAPAAPQLAPPGAGVAQGAAPGGGPVPITGMNATPRGGVI